TPLAEVRGWVDAGVVGTGADANDLARAVEWAVGPERLGCIRKAERLLAEERSPERWAAAFDSMFETVAAHRRRGVRRATAAQLPGARHLASSKARARTGAATSTRGTAVTTIGLAFVAKGDHHPRSAGLGAVADLGSRLTAVCAVDDSPRPFATG